MTLVKRIVLNEGAPPFEDLHMEIHLRYVSGIKPEQYDEIYNSGVDTLIGRKIETVLDAVNEERLMFHGGEQALLEVMSSVDDVDEVGHVSEDAESYVSYEIVLVDETGKSWSHLEMSDASDASSYEENVNNGQTWGPWGPEGRPES